MEIQSEDPNWANQIDNEIFHVPTSSEVERESNTQAQVALNLSIPTTCMNLNTTMGPKQAINSLSPPTLLYEELQLANINSWDSCTHPISLFGRLMTQDINVNNIKVSLEQMSDFISNHHLKNHKEDKIPCLTGFGKVVFELVSSIFKGGWDNLLEMDRRHFTTKSKRNSPQVFLSLHPIENSPVFPLLNQQNFLIFSLH